MSIQTHKCKDHGEFGDVQAVADAAAATYICPHSDSMDTWAGTCRQNSRHIIKPIAAAIVSGGTGGGKDMHLKR